MRFWVILRFPWFFSHTALSLLYYIREFFFLTAQAVGNNRVARVTITPRLEIGTFPVFVRRRATPGRLARVTDSYKLRCVCGFARMQNKDLAGR